MFEQFRGLPLHALVVHAAVVLVPLLVVAGLGYALVPRVRAWIGWAAALLAVAAPVAAFVAKQSGEDLQEVLVAKHYPPEILGQVAEHQRYGDLTMWFSFGLAVTTGLLLVVTSQNPRVARLPSWVRLALTAGVVVFGLLSAVYVALTGESGAKAVWTGVL
ncbi:MAG TPA: DUF2231 domain-containing protein [Micromonosporaceae bacterium]